MKNLIFLFGLMLTTITSFGQFIETDGSFSMKYERIRGFMYEDTNWVYDRGNMVTWEFIFNVDFFMTPDSDELFGTIALDENGESQWFYNFIGDVNESSDEYGDYSGYRVDILSKDDETGLWEFWQPGELRHYGSYTILNVGSPAFYKFQYFEYE